jgi:glycosyltransferase involved in cell wall biosynthesis
LAGWSRIALLCGGFCIAMDDPISAIARHEACLDLTDFSPARYDPSVLPGDRFNVLSAGEPLVVSALALAQLRDPRLNLVTEHPEPATYATADLLVFADTTDPFGAPILKAHASGLPVLALASCAAAALIEDGRSGCLVAAEVDALAAAARGLARRPALLERLATGGLLSARRRTLGREALRAA